MLADFTTRRLLDKIDFPTTTKNIFTSGFLARGRIPLVYESDEAAINAALDHVFRADPATRDAARIIRIRSTLDLEEIQVSDSLLDEVYASDSFIDADAFRPLDFADGDLF